jgi:M3 family oligoendopeptidase
MQYKYYPNRPETLTKEFVEQEYAKLRADLPQAEAASSGELWLDLFSRWNAIKGYVESEGNRINYMQSRYMANAEYENAEKYYREEVMPASDLGNSEILEALLKSKHKGAIAEKYGKYLIQALETNVEPLAPVNSDLRVKAGDLINQYDKLVAGGEVNVNGKAVTLAVARSMQMSTDPATRKAAFFAYREWFAQHREQIADIFDQLVHLRDKMAKNLGHENFVRLGYLGMRRTDYGELEAGEFRAAVRKYAVPLQKQISQRQAEDLGTDGLKPWDAGFYPSLSLPEGIAPVDQQLDKAQTVFNRLNPTLGGHFERMRKEGLIDLENRKAKRAGAFCTSFSDEGRVAILCNSTGDEDDVATLMHEMGHAFQGWESQPIESVDLQWPTMDACEVHSMGMEYLSLPQMSEFFGTENAEKFRRNRWRDSVEGICYICQVDEFQHWIYQNPNATPDERDAEWNRLTDIYKPGMDWSGAEELKKMRWYAQSHIFHAPFYYIDYAIAETGAMQLGLMDAQDHNKAMETYLRLCQIGGTKSVLDIFQTVGMRSPFDPMLMKDLMAHAAKELGIEQMSAA